MYHYGWKPQLPDFRDHVLGATIKKTSEFQDVDLRKLMPPIQDQGQTESCTAHAITGAVAYARYLNKLPLFVPSRLFVYYNERLMEGDVSRDAGAIIRDGIKSVAKWGTPDETLWPFSISNLFLKPLPVAYSSAITDLVSSYQSVPQTEAGILTALEHKLPVVFGMSLYSSFVTDMVAKTGNVSMPQTNEQLVGGHAMLIVGALVKQREFIVRNSWGTSWGKKGYCYIPFDYITNENLASDFWTISSIKK